MYACKQRRKLIDRSEVAETIINNKVAIALRADVLAQFSDLTT